MSLHRTPDDFRRHSKALIDGIDDYYEHIEKYPVLATAAHGSAPHSSY